MFVESGTRAPSSPSDSTSTSTSSSSGTSTSTVRPGFAVSAASAAQAQGLPLEGYQPTTPLLPVAPGTLGGEFSRMANEPLFSSSLDYPTVQPEVLAGFGASRPQFGGGGAPTDLRLDGHDALGPESYQWPSAMPHFHYSPHPGNENVSQITFLPVSEPDMTPLNLASGSTSTSPGSAASPLLFSPYTTYPSNGSNSSGCLSSTAPVAYPPELMHPRSDMPVLYDSQVRRPPIPSNSRMPPPAHSPARSNSLPAPLDATGREPFHPPTPQLHDYTFPPENPTFLHPPPKQEQLANPRSLETPPIAMPPSTNPPYGPRSSTVPSSRSQQRQSLSRTVPPFGRTKTILPIFNQSGSQVHAELYVKVDKGFFKADQDWTCYRRNYFELTCSYSLNPPSTLNPETLFLQRSGTPEAIRALAITISAQVSEEDGKAIELIQHTPKRDKGPTNAPEKIKVMPQLEPLSTYPDAINSSPTQLSRERNQPYSTSPSSPHATKATFLRMQFKNATANNGKRRAAQQYFLVLVELWADIAPDQSPGPHWVKIAVCPSEAVVVRGRSPGHYSRGDRNESTNTDPDGGSSGANTGARRDSDGTGPPSSSQPGRPSIPFSNSSRTGGGTYHSQHTYTSQSPSRVRPSDPPRTSGSSPYDGRTGSMAARRPDAPPLSPEETSNIENFEGYQYFPFPLFEPAMDGFAPRRQLPPVPLSFGGPESDPRYSAVPNTFPRSPRDSLFINVAFSNGAEHEPHANFAPPRNQVADPQLPYTRLGCRRFHALETSQGVYPVAAIP